MGTQTRYPGVYVEEIPSGVRTITGVATSITAFIGRALKGPVDKPISINGYGDFERIFGGLWKDSTLGYAVQDFYLNGGSQAIIVRLYAPDESETSVPAKSTLTIGKLALEAANEGRWGEKLRGEVKKDALEATAKELGVSKEDLFSLTVFEDIPGGLTETFQNLTVVDSARRIDRVLKERSQLIRWSSAVDLDSTTPDLPSGALIRDGISQLPFALRDLLAQAEANEKELTKKSTLTTAEQQTLAAAQKHLALKLSELVAMILARVQSKEAKMIAQQNKDKAQQKLDGLSADDPERPAAQATFEEADNKLQKATNDYNAANKKITDLDLPQDFQTALDQYITTAQALKASDGVALTSDAFVGPGKEGEKKGLYALKNVDIFNILVLPPIPYSNYAREIQPLVEKAAQFCEEKRAFYLVNPPTGWTNKDVAKTDLGNLGTNSKNAAVFFPMVKQPDPMRDNQMGDFSPVGAVAGVFARTDAERGIWKAPAGTAATLKGVPALAVSLTNDENGELNPLGINCLRNIIPYNRIVWGTRTLQGDDRLPSEWKYIPVRRLALFIEESLYRGTHWVVFEPNDEPLWAQIRLNVGAFMHSLFRQGAFQGTSAAQAYFVKCDKQTTTQTDIKNGIVNIEVGFAPLKPAEFVKITLQQTGQIVT